MRKRMFNRLGLLPGLAMVLLAGSGRLCSAESQARSFAGITNVISGPRAPGFPANLALEEYVASQFAASGFTNGAIAFEAPVFVPGKAGIIIEGAGEITLMPMLPSLMRPGNFGRDSFSSRLVYLGKARFEDLAAAGGIDLKGAIGLFDYDCSDRWMDLLRFGMEGCVFIEQPGSYHSDSAAKLYNTEVAVPRFLVSAADGARLREACKPSGQIAVTVEATPSKWRMASLRDPWVMIEGSDPLLSNEVVVITAPMDANSIVSERSFGARSAGNIWLLLGLLDHFRARPPARSVMLVGINAHTQYYLGERVLAWHLLASADDASKLRDLLAMDMRTARLYVEKYSLLKLDKPAALGLDLECAVEIMWKLDGKQQKKRVEARAKLLGEQADRLKNEAARGVKENGEPALQQIPPVDETLDLSEFTHEDVLSAIDEAAADLRAQTRGLSARLSPNSDVVNVAGRNADHLSKIRGRPADRVMELLRRAKPVFDDEKLLETWRDGFDLSTSKRIEIKKKLQEEAQRNLNLVKMLRMDCAGAKEMDPDERSRILSETAENQENMTRVLVMFNKIDIGVGRGKTRYRQIATKDATRNLLRRYRDDVVSRYESWAAEKRNMLDKDAANDPVRNALKLRKPVLVMCLGIDWAEERFGFCSINAVDSIVVSGWQTGFGKTCADVADGMPAPGGGPPPFVDAIGSVAGQSEDYVFNDPQSPVSFFHSAGNTPAVALKSAFASHGGTFGTDDRFERLDFDRAGRLYDWITGYIPAILAEPDLAAPDKLKQPNARLSLWTPVLSAFAMDEFAAKTTPDQAVPGALIALYRESGVELPPVVDGDVFNCYMSIAGETGESIFYGINDSALYPLVYKLDERSCVPLFTMDKGRILESQQFQSKLAKTPSAIFPMFPCEEFPVYDRTDPTLIGSGDFIVLREIWAMSSSMKSEPQKFGMHGMRSRSVKSASHLSTGPGAVYLWKKRQGVKQESLFLITGKNRCALNTSEEHPEGGGFSSAGQLGPDLFGHVARDMDSLNRSRLSAMKGVANELVRDFLHAGSNSLVRAAAAASSNMHSEYMQANYEALGYETKAYSEIRALNRDMMKAVIVYMALMIPFCYFLQKLLFSFTKLQHELLAFVALFVATYIGFRLIHPAFAIAMNPEAIFIAFVLGSIGVFITWVLHGRFESEMQIIFKNLTGMEQDVGYSTVGQTAMMIGVNNMKRRRVRTTLTTATIVLMVFTMLAFSSVSKKVKPTLIAKGAETPYTGLFYRPADGKPLSEQTARVFENAFGGRADVLVRRIMTPRVSAGSAVAWRMETTGTVAGIDGLVGLPPADSDFLGVFPIIHGRFFSSDVAEEVVISSSLADALKIGQDELATASVRFLGRELKVVGLFDDERYRMLRDLDPGCPLLPLKVDVASIAKTAAPDAAAEISMADAVDTAALAVVPAGFAAKLGARPYTVSIRLKDEEALWGEVNRALGITEARFHIGSRAPFRTDAESAQKVRAGIYFIGSSYRTSIGGLSRLIIPLLIAGLIILNTMLGTVHERRFEIAVYNAIGLNPMHIFLFFLAEALVYSVIGAIGGYLIGQVLAIIVQSLDLVRGMNINFSSLIVVYAIMFTIAVVLLSTIYPAYVATRTAVPSGKRKWSLPDHDGQRMRVAFPFIYQPDLAIGVMSYLNEYFSAHTEQSLGDQIVHLKDLSAASDSGGRPVYTMVYSVALAPYDLGVTQNVTFQVAYENEIGSYRVSMDNIRVSGQDTNWVTTNKPFLEKLRKILIRWRNIDPTEHRLYVEKGRALFGIK